MELEMAEIYPPDMEELSELLPDIDCGDCNYSSCMDFAQALLDKEAQADACPDLSEEYIKKLTTIIDMKKEPIPYNIMMEQTDCKVIEINHPDKHAPLLITCNFRETVRIMTEILERTGTSAFLLPTFTHGYSVDNAVYEKMFRAMDVMKAIQENEIGPRLEKSVMIIPGLADSEKNAIKRITRWDVLVGPISGYLAPLFILNNKESFM